MYHYISFLHINVLFFTIPILTKVSVTSMVNPYLIGPGSLWLRRS